MLPDGRRRVVIEAVQPEIDAGRFPVKRTVGEAVVVEADAFADGHDVVSCVLLWRPEAEPRWRESAMAPLPNDRWRGEFTVSELARYRYTVAGWVDRFATWTRDLGRRLEAGQDVAVDCAIGAALIQDAASRAKGPDVTALRGFARALGRKRPDAAIGLDPELRALMERHADRGFATTYERELVVDVERERARFGAWYELFPRSAGAAGRHGTFADVVRLLPDIAEMGFDVLYLPPIHPIGTSYRKGRNNAASAAPDDVGSPWAIGGSAGGHTAIHPELGSLEDFRALVVAAEGHGLEVALDLAFQASPDHPYVREHPEWFSHRPDGTIQYAENPPKRYQDIYPFDFESEAREALWEELAGVVRYWIAQGVRIFRVDNPHTKPFAFWEWLLSGVRRDHPETIFLSEAFTRPKVMYRLAKVGFSQSYTYFAWRNTKEELVRYFTEITTPPTVEFFRPSLWPNTPDILTEYLQVGGRPAFAARAVLAATLGATYGIYGPAFELCEAAPLVAGREEYLDSEKYQIRHWERRRQGDLRRVLSLLNRARRENPALRSDRSLAFHPVDNDELIAYSKRTPDRSNVILTVVNLDPHHRQSGWVHVPLEDLAIEADEPFQVHDLLGGGRYIWSGSRNYVEVDPQALPAHVFRVRRRLRRERDFEYFL
ncbi:MAG TPA: alpha-1,4-glucan--maltose-1-phosphate maltosyltransferase [Candidatus Limnocylindrales bacterium]|nr:alpha-1,4-glucan--maltose-1-phosphate maltosyltransferase [Candidatus Limnocylindrales bacterium]